MHRLRRLFLLLLFDLLFVITIWLTPFFFLMPPYYKDVTINPSYPNPGGAILKGICLKCLYHIVNDVNIEIHKYNFVRILILKLSHSWWKILTFFFSLCYYFMPSFLLAPKTVGQKSLPIFWSFKSITNMNVLINK